VKLKNFLPTAIPLKELVKNSPVGEYETRIILEDLFGVKPTDFIDDKNFSRLNSYKFNKITTKISAGYPLQYAVGFTYFANSKIFVNESVLIPRPESEMVVELGKEFLSDRINEKTTIVDVGTGSGCIIISLKNNFLNRKNFEFFGVDVSNNALKTAQKNARENKAEIEFLKSDLLSSSKLPKRIDLILANLPYVDLSLQNPDLKYEPENAIYCANEGFHFIEDLIRQLPNRLSKNGLAVFEVGYNHTKNIQSIAKEFNQLKFSIQKDLNNYPRYLLVRFKKDMPLV